nr:DNA repair protein [Pseudozyma thailandica]
MSLGKRPAAEDADRTGAFSDEDEALDAVSPKRIRTNRQAPNGTHSRTPQQSEAAGSRSQAAAQPDDLEDVETPDEDEEEDEEDEIDSDDDRVEQERRRAEADQGAAQSGIVERIELRNFMCHKNFSVDFGPKLNFIMGRNGSGKSTILTALMIALGGKTSSTNRGSSLKDLVKKGEAYASITVTMRNHDSDAFRPDAYGDKIIIERRILAEGGGTWKMKAANGKVVATTKAELESYCDYANIQPDNPIHILTQDTARQFLGSSDPGEVYKFFLEGTQLSQLARDYEIIDNNVKAMRSALALRKGGIEGLRGRRKEALQLWNKVRETRGYQDKIDELDREYVWVQVHDALAQFEQAVEKTERYRAKQIAVEKSRDESIEALKRSEERIHQLEQESNNFEDVFTPLHQEHEELVRKSKDLASQIKAFNAQERQLNDNIIELNKGIDRYDDQIREEIAKLADKGQAHRQELEDKRQDMQRKRQELQDGEIEKEEQLRELDRKIDTANQREVDESQRLHRLRDEYQSNNARITQLRESTRNRLTAYGGPKVPALVQAINNETGWRSKPLGPLGTHLKLKDMRWQRVVESVIGNNLNAFFVSNHTDRSRLKQMMDRIGFHSPIITGSERLFDYSSGEPDPEILTILRVLDFDNEVVKRQLIISAHIERAALVEHRPQGDILMRQQPYNVQACFSMDVYNVGGGTTGSMSTALNEYKGPPRLSQNVGDAIRSLENDQQRIEPEIAECTQSLRNLKQEKQQLEREKHNGKTELNNMRRQKDNLRRELGRLDEQMQEAAPGNISALEEAKREMEAEKEVILQQFQSIQAQKAAIEAQRAPIQGEIQELEEKKRQFQDQMGGLQGKLVDAVAERVKQTSNRDHWLAKHAKIETDIQASEAEETRREEEHRSLEEEAKQYCDEVETNRNLTEIGAEKRQLQILKKKAAAEAGITLEQAAEELQRRDLDLNKAEEEMNLMESAERKLRAALTIRYAKWNYFRRCIATRAKANFSRNLKTRGYTGKLAFNHQAGRLTLVVDTQDPNHRSATQTQQKTQRHSNKGMSGGERSFATACLLLSLWQAMSSPIRCLDEFDIFMDQVNRRVALGLILNEAKATPHVQYILITPQDMPDMKAEMDGVKMLVIAPPERAEGTME